MSFNGLISLSKVCPFLIHIVKGLVRPVFDEYRNFAETDIKAEVDGKFHVR